MSPVPSGLMLDYPGNDRDDNLSKTAAPPRRRRQTVGAPALRELGDATNTPSMNDSSKTTIKPRLSLSAVVSPTSSNAGASENELSLASSKPLVLEEALLLEEVAKIPARKRRKSMRKSLSVPVLKSKPMVTPSEEEESSNFVQVLAEQPKPPSLATKSAPAPATLSKTTDPGLPLKRSNPNKSNDPSELLKLTRMPSSKKFGTHGAGLPPRIPLTTATTTTSSSIVLAPDDNDGPSTTFKSNMTTKKRRTSLLRRSLSADHILDMKQSTKKRESAAASFLMSGEAFASIDPPASTARDDKKPSTSSNENENHQNVLAPAQEAAEAKTPAKANQETTATLSTPSPPGGFDFSGALSEDDGSPESSFVSSKPSRVASSPEGEPGPGVSISKKKAKKTQTTKSSASTPVHPTPPLRRSRRQSVVAQGALVKTPSPPKIISAASSNVDKEVSENKGSIMKGKKGIDPSPPIVQETTPMSDPQTQAKEAPLVLVEAEHDDLTPPKPALRRSSRLSISTRSVQVPPAEGTAMLPTEDNKEEAARSKKKKGRRKSAHVGIALKNKEPTLEKLEDDEGEKNNVSDPVMEKESPLPSKKEISSNIPASAIKSCLRTPKTTFKRFEKRKRSSKSQKKLVKFEDQIDVRIMTPTRESAPGEPLDLVDDNSEIVQPYRPFPHVRSDCPHSEFKSVFFSTSGKAKQSGLGDNSEYCESCYCFVCDKWASECESWHTPGSNLLVDNHCCASNTSTESAVARQEYRQSLLQVEEAVEGDDPKEMIMFANSPGPFSPEHYSAPCDPTLTQCRRCGWMSRFSHRNFQYEANKVSDLDYCHCCGRIASELDFGKRQSGPYTPVATDFDLGTKEIQFQIVAHDPRQMKEYKYNWLKNGEEWGGYSEEEMEEDVFEHKIGEHPTLNSIKELQLDGSDPSKDEIRLENGNDIAFFHLLDQAMEVSKDGEFFLVEAEIRAVWDAERRTGVSSLIW